MKLCAGAYDTFVWCWNLHETLAYVWCVRIQDYLYAHCILT